MIKETVYGDQPKYLICYLYSSDDGTEGPNLDFKALSLDEDLADEFSFVAIRDPSDQINTSGELPTVIGVMKESDKYPEGSVFNLQGMQTVVFNELKATLFS